LSIGNTNQSEIMAAEQYTTMTRKGQITVPAAIRKALGLKVGDKVAISLEEHGDLRANLRPVRSVTELTFGAVAVRAPVDPDAVRDAFMEAAVERDERSKRSSQ
jgi:AbrB family looped-hinge helix DNA binding protein